MATLVSVGVRWAIRTSTSVDLATFATPDARRVFAPQTLEGRGAQLAGPRPLDELDLRDELRFDEMGFFRRSAAIKPALVLGECLHRALQLIQRSVCKTGPDLPSFPAPPICQISATPPAP